MAHSLRKRSDFVKEGFVEGKGRGEERALVTNQNDSDTKCGWALPQALNSANGYSHVATLKLK